MALTRPQLRHLPWAVFAAALLIGAAMTWAVYQAEVSAKAARFERIADRAVSRVADRLNQHVALLKAAEGLFTAKRGDVRHSEFSTFIQTLDIEERYSGIQGIGFARMIETGRPGPAVAEIQRNYNFRKTVYPATDAKLRTPIVLLEPMDTRNERALGYDMYSNPVRRAAMNSAISTGRPHASGPVELVQEITSDKQTGFLVYLPFKLEAPEAGPAEKALPVTGFVYAPFRAGDLINAALGSGPDLPVALRVLDKAAPDLPLFDSTALAPAGTLTALRTIPVAGRDWEFEVYLAGSVTGITGHLASALLGLLSLLFAAAAGLAMRAKQMEAHAAKRIAASAARQAEYRGLLLAEMKHRLKNHIARIQSIARQSLRAADGLEEFSDSFMSRLQSMAAAQDLLTGDQTPSASLGVIIARELQQALPDEDVERVLQGPDVRLGEQQSQAVNLVIHELTTNAMKYGGLAGGGNRLRVRWDLRAGEEGEQVFLRWTEAGSGFREPEGQKGFGSRLINASVQGELDGSITRSFGAEGYVVEISFPLDPTVQLEPSQDTAPAPGTVAKPAAAPGAR